MGPKRFSVSRIMARRLDSVLTFSSTNMDAWYVCVSDAGGDGNEGGGDVDVDCGGSRLSLTCLGRASWLPSESANES